MNQINTEQILSQIRTLNKALDGSGSAGQVQATGFGDTLRQTLDAVNDAQQAATELKIGFQAGTTDASLAEVMIASEKASLSFRAITEVRNKLITAYQDIMNMPV